MALVKIISGGQTGVDRAALDAALAVGFPCGGLVSGGSGEGLRILRRSMTAIVDDALNRPE
jgi:Circularly permutated YpsA SLOG family